MGNTILVGAALLAVTQSAAPTTWIETPAGLKQSFGAAATELAYAGDCLDAKPNPDQEHAFQGAMERHRSGTARAAGIWGKIDPELEDRSNRHMLCSTDNVASALARAVTALDASEQTIAQAALSLKSGLWVGALKLCRDTVSKTGAGRDVLTGERVTTVTLAATGRATFASLTRRSVGSKLTIRADDAIISEPYVNETIAGGVFQISAPEAALLDRAEALAARDC